MATMGRGETRRFNTDPIDTVDYHLDIDYIGATAVELIGPGETVALRATHHGS